MLCFVLLVGTSSLAQAEGFEEARAGSASPFVAGAWVVEAGEASPKGRIVEIDDGRLRLEREGRWSLVAQQISLNYDILGRLEFVGARGEVRLVGRNSGQAPVSYAMGDFAWLDAAGVRGLLMGQSVAMVRDDWRIEAAHIEVEFGTATLALRGVKSGEDRARRDDK
ncbi:MAG: hypothetical protein ACQEVA_21605 [Myxococcota bacterium]